MITRMNSGEDYNGREIDAATSFFLGVAVNPAADDLDYELERFHQKLEAGAQFAMTQVLFDLAYLESFLERLGGSCPIPLLVGIFYVRSHSLAQRLQQRCPGSSSRSTSRRDSGRGRRCRRHGARDRAGAQSKRHASWPRGFTSSRPSGSRRSTRSVLARTVRRRDRLRARVGDDLPDELGRNAVAAGLARPAGEHRRPDAPLRIDPRPPEPRARPRRVLRSPGAGSDRGRTRRG